MALLRKPKPVSGRKETPRKSSALTQSPLEVTQTRLPPPYTSHCPQIPGGGDAHGACSVTSFPQISPMSFLGDPRLLSQAKIPSPGSLRVFFFFWGGDKIVKGWDLGREKLLPLPPIIFWGL